MIKYICPVCYYPKIDEYPNDGLSFEICPCCFVEFGYDGVEETFALRRQEWIAQGRKFIASEHREISADDKKLYEILKDEMLDCFLDLETVKHLNRLRANEAWKNL